jgi:hypothetical protein
LTAQSQSGSPGGFCVLQPTSPGRTATIIPVCSTAYARLSIRGSVVGLCAALLVEVMTHRFEPRQGRLLSKVVGIRGGLGCQSCERMSLVLKIPRQALKVQRVSRNRGATARRATRLMMRVSFIGLPLLMLSLVGFAASPVTQNAKPGHYYSGCYCRFGYPPPFSCEPEVYCTDEGGHCTGLCRTSAQSN